jgi:predicted GIY-YIG superfamily endonuclease
VFTVYVLRCADKTLYIGYTADLDARVFEHNEGRGCAYTAARRPVSIVYTETFALRVEAMAREKQLKRWTTAKKEALINRDFKSVHRLAKRRVFAKKRV